MKNQYYFINIYNNPPTIQKKFRKYGGKKFQDAVADARSRAESAIQSYYRELNETMGAMQHFKKMIISLEELKEP